MAVMTKARRTNPHYTAATYAGKYYDHQARNMPKAALKLAKNFLKSGLNPVSAIASTASELYNERRGGGKSKKASVRFGRLAGKVKKFKKVSRRVRGKNGLTRNGLTEKGVHTAQELRFTTKVDSASKYEALAVGHTSMPLKVVSLNLARALIKWVMSTCITIKDFNSNCTSFGVGAGDIIRVIYFNSLTAISPTLFDVTVDVSETFETLAVKLAYQFESLISIGKFRWETIEYIPLDGTRKLTAIVKNLQSAKVKCITKSVLKLQNRTQDDNSADPEMDDLDNVPLIGYVYHCKGNNFFNRNNRRLLRGIGTTNLQTNEVMLYESYGQQPDTVPGAPSQYHRRSSGGASTSFTRPAEPPKPYEILNCLKQTKLSVNPGEIKTSSISQNFEMTLDRFFKILYAEQMSNANEFAYNPLAGFTRVMYLEKAIGSEGTSVSIAAETQIDCWLAITGKLNRTTNPVTFQSSYFGYEQAAP